KFCDIKCKISELKPDAIVLVATVRALKYNGGLQRDELGVEDLQALERGIVNLEKHIENIQKYKVPIIVTLNKFSTDTQEELLYIEDFCKKKACEFALCEVWEKGGIGGVDLAKKVISSLDTRESNFSPLYKDELSIKEKIETVAKEI